MLFWELRKLRRIMRLEMRRLVKTLVQLLMIMLSKPIHPENNGCTAFKC
jgi:hypothetical protein|uniref:Uncharacterized protein n=1 Tax=Picea glauca TaxID=3330 RepID=A0A117NG00_PICGL|nr:hypothetical protein ABT39_MTgene2143 [Picea glauca]